MVKSIISLKLYSDIKLLSSGIFFRMSGYPLNSRRSSIFAGLIPAVFNTFSLKFHEKHQPVIKKSYDIYHRIISMIRRNTRLSSFYLRFGRILCAALENNNVPRKVVINVEIVIVTKLNQNGISSTISSIKPTKIPHSKLYWTALIQTFLTK